VKHTPLISRGFSAPLDHFQSIDRMNCPKRRATQHRHIKAKLATPYRQTLITDQQVSLSTVGAILDSSMPF
jgi:hypothetical protein